MLLRYSVSRKRSGPIISVALELLEFHRWNRSKVCLIRFYGEVCFIWVYFLIFPYFLSNLQKTLILVLKLTAWPQGSSNKTFQSLEFFTCKRIFRLRPITHIWQCTQTTLRIHMSFWERLFRETERRKILLVHTIAQCVSEACKHVHMLWGLSNKGKHQKGSCSFLRISGHWRCSGGGGVRGARIPHWSPSAEMGSWKRQNTTRRKR